MERKVDINQIVYTFNDHSEMLAYLKTSKISQFCVTPITDSKLQLVVPKKKPSRRPDEKIIA